MRQEQTVKPAAPAAPDLALPEESGGIAQPMPDGQTTVIVEKVVFSGLEETAVTESAAQAAVAAMIGHEQSFAGLRAMTDPVTALLRNSGLLLGKAILPPQTISQGVLHIQIVPGRYDRADIHNASAVRTSVIAQLVDRAAPQGAVVRKAPLERVALLLSEIPGAQADVALKAGQKSGTSALEVNVSPGKRFGAYVGLDNQGDPTTGRSRVMAGFYANELLGFGDQLRVDLLDAYENSNLFNGALDYSRLAGSYGTRVGVNYSHLHYRYRLNGLGFNGYSDNWGAYVSQPWIRTAHARADIRLDAGQQWLTDQYPQRFADAIADGQARGRKQINFGTLSLLGSVASTVGGISTFAVRATAGEMDYRNAAARAFGGDNILHTTGHFFRFNYRASHDQHVAGPFSLYVNLDGQMAAHNLDASQKFLMGGPSAVRAYDIGDGAVDEGTLVTVEMRSRWPISQPRWLGHAPALTLAAFYDQGWGRQNKNDRNPVNHARMAGDGNRFSLAGAGLYATLADAGNYALTLTWAHRTGQADPVSAHRNRNQFWLSSVKTF